MRSRRKTRSAPARRHHARDVPRAAVDAHRPRLDDALGHLASRRPRSTRCAPPRARAVAAASIAWISARPPGATAARTAEARSAASAGAEAAAEQLRAQRVVRPAAARLERGGERGGLGGREPQRRSSAGGAPNTCTTPSVDERVDELVGRVRRQAAHRQRGDVGGDLARGSRRSRRRARRAAARRRA